MYFNKAVVRINNINWNEYGKNGTKEDSSLAFEYLRRVAAFFKDNSIKARTPIYVNIADLLGYENKINLADCCKDIVIKTFENKRMPKNVIESYLQLSKFADMDSDKAKYLDIYEPLIRIIERGGEFDFKDGGLMIYNSSWFPFNDWYSKFIEKAPRDIINL